MGNKKIIGISILTAAALSFATLPATSALAKGQINSVKCYGINSCKGMSECKTAKNSCKGMNSCKGQGLALVASKKTCEDANGAMTES